MDQENSIAALRTRVSSLVEKEAALVSQAMELSRAKDRRGVDALFAQVQMIQVERGNLTRQIGNLIGTQRMHVASEVWKPGTYGYREEVGGSSLRVQVVDTPLGLQVKFPDRQEAVPIELLKGIFDGPMAVDGTR